MNISLAIATLLLCSETLCAISWDEIKQSPLYLYGEGWGASDAEADKHALADLISKISVNVSSSFTVTEDELQQNGQTNSESYARSKVETYSQATLTNTGKIVIAHEPDAHIGRYILRSEIAKIFKSRENRIKEMIGLAKQGERLGKIDDALRYYYWAFCLLKTLQRPNETTYTDESGTHILINWIPNQMNAVFDNISIRPIKTENNVMEIAVEYKKRPVDSFDYTYFDGQNWSNIYSARDGRGVIELSPGAITDNIRIKCEYEYRNEAHIDNEIENVFNIVKGQAFRKSYITVSGAAVNATQPEQNAAVPAIETSETNSIASAIDETPYRLIMDNVLNAIASKNYNAAEQYFTPNGADMFRKLINYGKARILDSANLQFSEIDGKTACRNAAMSFSFRNGMRKSFVEDVVFTFNSDKKIDYIAFGLGDRAQNDILNKGEWSLTARNAIMNFLENYKTAYALKRLDYIEQVFDDNAVIISGCVIRRPKGRELENSEQFISNQYVRYTRVNKDEYIDRLRRSFAGKEFINIRFSNNDVRKMSKGGELYCIQIKQDYYSSNYGDSGYLFLMVDLNRPDAPIIKVRTWQPQPDPDFGLIGPEFF
ncbi:MAG TPA: LPP20 family lipoprotein [Candidatus Limisoma intestinavium]|uniref:LPP20 family lipoprotein n=1 Tax=Candidatus Limisoma intestinavium TaxID=2840856 RepID=A0A9D1IKH8_9BACT|nr:LPP20 family lipoprotein [Candidatus Limisoma intestinavium]